MLNSMMKYVCFTLISTFNLTPSTTGMTSRDSRKTLMFYWLVWLVTSCPSLLALKYGELSYFVLWSVLFSNHYDWLCWSQFGVFGSLSAFLGCFFVFGFSVGWWVCIDFYLVSSFVPYRELVRLVCLVVLKCNRNVCFNVILETCGDWYDWLSWS